MVRALPSAGICVLQAGEMVTIQQFSGAFLQRLNAPDFGLSAYQSSLTEPGSLTPAAKEIHAKRLQAMLSSPVFLQQIHQLGSQHQHLAQAQQLALQHKRTTRPLVTALRNARETLGSLQKKIASLDDQVSSFLGWTTRMQLHEAIRNLKAVESRLSELEGMKVSEIYPPLRTAVDKPSQWTVIPWLKPYDYPLPTLRTRAPDQWLIVQLDNFLAQSLCRQHVTERTRCTIITVLFECLGLGRLEPTTIETYLRRRRR